MPDHLSIPDALAADLRELFLDDQPLSPELPDGSIRLKFETDELPSPRLVITAGDPRRIEGMDATARVPFSLLLVHSLDGVSPDVHRAQAGRIEAWLREIRVSHRRAVLGSRVYLHDLFTLHPTFGFGEDREQIATLRGEAVVTLAVTA